MHSASCNCFGDLRHYKMLPHLEAICGNAFLLIVIYFGLSFNGNPISNQTVLQQCIAVEFSIEHLKMDLFKNICSTSKFCNFYFFMLRFTFVHCYCNDI